MSTPCNKNHAHLTYPKTLEITYRLEKQTTFGNIFIFNYFLLLSFLLAISFDLRHIVLITITAKPLSTKRLRLLMEVT